MFLKELNWELKQGDDTFRDSINLPIFISYNVFVVSCSPFDHTDILNVIPEGRHWLHYDISGKNDPCTVHPKSLNCSIKYLFFASLAVVF